MPVEKLNKMTLRQANGRASSSCGPASSAVTIGASSSSSMTNVTRRENGNGSKTSKKHTLLDQKRRQWEEERAEQEEWYPFGRPGGGAPVKSPIERLSQERLRRHSSANCNSDSGSVTDTSGCGFNTSLPVYSQLSNVENDQASIHHPMLRAPNAIDSTPMPAGYMVGPNGYYVPYPTVVVSCPTPFTFPDTCPTCPPAASTPCMHPIHTPGPPLGPPMPLPGAVDPSTSDSSNGQPDLRKHAPCQQHQQPCGYVQGIRMVTVNGQDAIEGSVVSGGKNSLTASSTNPQYWKHMQMLSHPQRPSVPQSYTEEWADQLQHWQIDDAQSPRRDRPTSLAISNQSQSTVPLLDMQPLQYAITSTPIGPGVAWVAPVQTQNGQQSRKFGVSQHQQRMAVVSPMHSKAPSISGNETLDGSATIQLMSASFSGSLSNGENSRSHQRHSRDSDEKQVKMLEQKLALEEQLEEKRRKQLIEQQRERREVERAEQERRVLEEREILENEQERSRWKKLADQEEKREEVLMGSLQRAQQEARSVRRARLFRHASTGRQSDSDGYESMSPPAVNQSTHSSAMRKEEEKDDGSLNSPGSSGPIGLLTPAPFARAQSLPPAPVLSVESPADDRPIRPMTKDPLQIWEEQGYTALGEDAGKSQQRNTPVRMSLRKSRSRDAAKLEMVPRSASLERKRGTSGTAKQATSETTKAPVNGKQLENGKASVEMTNGQQGDRVKSAGSASNATFILDSKETETSTKKPEFQVDRKGEHLMNDQKKKVSSAVNWNSTRERNGGQEKRTLATEKNGKKEKTTRTAENGKKKLLERRQSAEKPLLVGSAVDNPWGDKLGGLNPLLQPIVTRRRKSRTSAADPLTPTLSIEESEHKSIADSSPSQSVATRLDKALELDKAEQASSKVCESDANNNKEKKNVSCETLNEAQSTASTANQNATKPVYTRAPSLDRFNAKNPLYGSISMKMKRPTEYQNKLLEQLSLLRQQLKKTQKEVEGGVATQLNKSSAVRD